MDFYEFYETWYGKTITLVVCSVIGGVLGAIVYERLVSWI